jgi:hypothetical protein
MMGDAEGRAINGMRYKCWRWCFFFRGLYVSQKVEENTFLVFRRGPLPLQGSTNLLQSVRDKNDKIEKSTRIRSTTVLDMNCIKLEF